MKKLYLSLSNFILKFRKYALKEPDLVKKKEKVL